MANERDNEIWDDATNAVCQAMQEQKMCNCPDGDCLAAKVGFSPEKIATSTRPAAPVKGLETWTDDELWQIVNEFDDRTSPEDYPEMIMLNEAEFRDFLDRGRALLRADNAALKKQLEQVVTAWESLPGGRNYSVSVMQDWISGPMKKAVDNVRKLLRGSP